MSIALMGIKATTQSVHLFIFNEGNEKILRASREEQTGLEAVNQAIPAGHSMTP
jgi:hypothetical protein